MKSRKTRLTDEWCLSHGIISVVPVAIDRSIPVGNSLEWLKKYRQDTHHSDSL